MRPWLAPLLLLAGCAGIEGDIKRAEMKEVFLDLTRGKDRGAPYYTATIAKAKTEIIGGRYQFQPPAHISHFLIYRSVRGLGGTRIKTSDDLALITDWLLFALVFDPTLSVRSAAAEELGRVLLRLPMTELPPAPSDALTDQRIHTAAQDLHKYGKDVQAGKKVTHDQVVERMEALARESPPTRQAALQAVRAFAIFPVRGASSKKIRAASERLVPALVRSAILIALRETACGDPLRSHREADPAAIVRYAAAKVLASTRSPIAVRAAAVRLDDGIDPAERDADVRRQLVRYLGRVRNSPQAFSVCLLRLEDVDSGVRYRAQEALQNMTGARVGAYPDAWRAWRDDHPEWQVGEGATR
jgi:HEAT repeat protein